MLETIAVVNVSLTLKLILSFFSVALLIGSLSHAGLAKKKTSDQPVSAKFDADPADFR